MYKEPSCDELKRRVDELNAQLQKKTNELSMRCRELNCLYEISNLVQRPGITLEDLVQQTVEIAINKQFLWV